MEPRPQHPRITRDDVMTAAEVADMLNLSRAAVYRLANTGQLPERPPRPHPSASCARASRRCCGMGERPEEVCHRGPAPAADEVAERLAILARGRFSVSRLQPMTKSRGPGKPQPR